MKKFLLLSFSIVISFLLSAQKGDFYFIENKGQIANNAETSINNVKYYTENNGLKMFLTNTGIIYQWEKYTSLKPEKPHRDFLKKTEEDSFSVETYRTDVTLIGANANPVIETYDEQQSYLNFYLPQCPDGALNVKHFKKLIYRNVYDGIDWVWKFTDEGIKYDFVVHPGADFRQIQLKFNDEAKPYIDAEGNLKIENQLGSLIEKAPISFSDNNIVKSNFVLKENALSFSVEEYNLNKTLIIDPSLIWGTYFGGSERENLRGSGVDTLGNYYICGFSYSQSLTVGNVHQKNLNGSVDGFISKLDSNGVVVWTTYFGGNDRDFFFCLAIDKSLNIYAGGNTTSTSGVTKIAHQNNYGGGSSDGFLAKFSNNGTLLWSTYYGGARDESLEGIAVDKFSNVYVAGTTNSHEYGVFFFNGTNYSQPFPRSYIRAGYYAKFSSNGVRLFGTQFGSNKNTGIAAIEVDDDLNIYFSGYTEADKDITYNASQPNSNGNTEIFLAKVKSNLTREWVTYFGGEKNEYTYEITIDTGGNVFICGLTWSKTGIFYNGHSSKFTSNQSRTGFLSKFNNSGNKLWSTYYSDGGYCHSVVADNKGNVYMVGTVTEFNQVSEIGYKGFKNGPSNFYKSDGFVAKFDSSGVRVWSSFYGGGETDELLSVAINKKNNTIYAAGNTQSDNYISYANTSKYDNKIDAFAIKVKEGMNDTVYKRVCNNDSVTLVVPNIIPNSEIKWTATASITGPLLHTGSTYTFKVNGTTTVWARVIADNGGVVETVRPKYITAEDIPNVGFNVNDSLQCLSTNNFTFTNTTTVFNSPLSYYWQLGAKDTSTQKNSTFSFDTAQTHTVKLIAKTGFGCTDSIEKTVIVAPKPAISFNPGLQSLVFCEEEEFTLANQSMLQSGSLTYEWDFGTGDTTSQKNPTYLYNTQGSYTIQLKAISDNGCLDSLSKAVVVNPLPTVNTILGGGTAQRNTQRSYFLLNTQSKSKYSWDVDGGIVNGAPFGDSLQVQWGLGTSGIITTFEENEFGCTDTVATKYISLLNTSINNINAINYSVYPIPASNYLLLKVNTEVTYTLTDILGKEVTEGIALPSTENRINTSFLNNGVYLLQLYNANTVIATQKIMVRR